MRSLIVLNETRYYTEDIQTLAYVEWEEKFRPPSHLHVSTYFPSKNVREMFQEELHRSIFVKLARNADENNRAKELKLVKPTSFPGISELEMLGASGGEAPREVVRQVLYRLHLIRYFHNTTDGQGADSKSMLPMVYVRRRIEEDIEKKGLRLRFRDKDVGADEMRWRHRAVSTELRVRELTSRTANLTLAIQHKEKRLRQQEEEITNLRAELEKAESARLNALAQLLSLREQDDVRP